MLLDLSVQFLWCTMEAVFSEGSCFESWEGRNRKKIENVAGTNVYVTSAQHNKVREKFKPKPRRHKKIAILFWPFAP